MRVQVLDAYIVSTAAVAQDRCLTIQVMSSVPHYWPLEYLVPLVSLIVIDKTCLDHAVLPFPLSPLSALYTTFLPPQGEVHGVGPVMPEEEVEGSGI